MTYVKLKKIIPIYVTIPVIIFFFGWLKLYLAIPASLLLVFAVYAIIRKTSLTDDSAEKEFVFSLKTTLFLIALSMVWCFFAGQGGMYYQSFDHEYRNAIFRDLINFDWPVIYSETNSALIYYIAHWMVPAGIGKLSLFISGSEAIAWTIGNIFLFIWSSIGVWLVLMMVVKTVGAKTKNTIIATCLIFIMFSGLDLIGQFFAKYNVTDHLESWAGYFQYSSLTTCLFWVFNQTIVPWLLTLCIINEKSVKNFAFWGLICLPYGPLPFVGIFIYCICLGIKFCVSAIRSGELIRFIKEIFSIQNIVAIIIIFPVFFFYYKCNSYIGGESGKGLRLTWSGEDVSFSAILIGYIIFVVLEFGIISRLILFDNKKNFVFYVTFGSLMLMPLFRIGSGIDFSMRASIPALLILACLSIKSVLEYFHKFYVSKGKFSIRIALLIFCLILGSFTVITEFKRGIDNVIKTHKINPVADTIKTLNRENITFENFISKDYKTKDFFKYLSR